MSNIIEIQQFGPSPETLSLTDTHFPLAWLLCLNGEPPVPKKAQHILDYPLPSWSATLKMLAKDLKGGESLIVAAKWRSTGRENAELVEKEYFNKVRPLICTHLACMARELRKPIRASTKGVWTASIRRQLLLKAGYGERLRNK
jgi:hypothetical protein